MDQIHNSADVQMINVLLENIVSIPFLYIILSLQTSVTARLCCSVKDLPRAVEAKSHSEGVCVLSAHSWDVDSMELYLQMSSLILRFQNKYMDNGIYCVRIKVEHKE